MEPMRPSGENLTFFFSDVEGSTRAAAMLGDRFAAALEEHRRLVRAALAASGGEEVSTAGDSFFAVFPVAGNAFAAASAIQRALVGAAANQQLRARIGLHTGQAVVVGDDYVGLDVHRAARIADAGHGGQILVSETTAAALQGSVPDGLALVDLGRHRLKDVGPERLWAVTGAGLPPGPYPAPRSLEAHPTNLPSDATALVGRTRELAELRELVLRERLVSVTGAGGIGKSRVAIAVARSLVAELMDGVFHLDLTSTPDAAAAVSAILEVLGLRPNPDEDALRGLLDRLRNRDLLLVLDTVDRVEAFPALVATIAAACPRIHVLLTSRSPLHVGAEREFALPPLAVDESVELYIARARVVRAGFELDAARRAEVQRLAERLDGIPLAIELAAARSRLLSPAALLDRLDRHLPALGAAGSDAPDRQRTLHDTIAWSADLLSPKERTAFQQLGVLDGGFELAAIEGIIDPPEGTDVASIVEVLVDRSLVVAEQGGLGEPRFRMLSPIRAFARDALRAAGDEARLQDRHADYWAGVVGRETQELDRDAALAAVHRIGLDEPNIRAALQWLLAKRPPTAGIELAVALSRYWRLRGRVAEGLDWLGRARSLVDGASPQTRADVLFSLGILFDDGGSPDQAAPLLEEALALRRELADDVGVARTLNSLGVVARSLGDLDRAEGLLEESLERKSALRDRRGIAISLSNLGVVASDRGRHELAVEYMARALQIDEEIGGANAIVGCANLATTLIRAGRFDEGVAQLAKALPGIEELADPDLVIEALAGLAAAALARDDTRSMARLSAAAESVAAAERAQLHATDRRELDDLRKQADRLVRPEDLAAIRAEARVVDLAAAIALARDAVQLLSGITKPGEPEGRRESKRPEEPPLP